MTSNEDLIVFIQAEINGKTIQLNRKGTWNTKDTFTWHKDCNYRIKPEPREWYINEYPEHLGYKGLGYLHPTREIADNHGDSNVIGVIHVKEVLE